MKRTEWLELGSDNLEFCALDPVYTSFGDVARIYSYEAFETTEMGKRSLGVFRSLRAARAAVEAVAVKSWKRTSNPSFSLDSTDLSPAKL